uniref:Variant surface glycoprotein 1125.4240 n=1 Tax=Trypanosoma brucei TaxID=5691 RepID=A0A1J0RA60_9TRYP|nr:variant surface glycoprotein 1125.4240 [Trypanosoma brucei]
MQALQAVGTISLVFIITAKRTAANYAVNANAREASMLCTLVSWAGQRSKWNPDSEQETDDVDDILKLNMSLADEQWRKHFLTDDAEPKAVTYDASKHKQITGSAETWAEWTKQAQAAAKDNAQTAIKKKLKLEHITNGQLQAAKNEIIRLAAELQVIKDSTKGGTSTSETIDETKVQKEINSVVYGEEKEPADTALRTTNFGTAKYPRDAMCDGSSSDPKVKTVLGILACICLADNTNNGQKQGKVCAGNTGITDQTWNPTTTQTPPQGALAALLKICPRQGETKLTADKLPTAVDAISSLLTYDNAAGYIGIHQGAGCTAAQNAGMCVKYTDLANAQKDPKEAIGWLKKLNTLATNMAAGEAAAVRKSEATRQLNIKAKMLHSLVNSATVAQQPGVSGAAQTQTEQAERVVNKQKECTAHKDNKKACTEAKCSWKGGESEKGECEVGESKVKEEVKIENSDKEGASNTTGSNSFVIHKAPLLLAVLILE